jgi:predicted amidohydrolase YtcJ
MFFKSPDYAIRGDPKNILDAIIPNKPAIMMEETSHSVWVNTLALKAAGKKKKKFVKLKMLDYVLNGNLLFWLM